MICTFFGHRNCPDSISTKLKAIIEELILNYNTDKFYVGNNGNFDSLVRLSLFELKKKYPHIEYEIVLAYIPVKNSLSVDTSHTIIPDGIEKTPKRYAVCYRNKWMLDRSDIVIAFVNKSYGGAAQFFELAKRKNKHCINLYELL